MRTVRARRLARIAVAAAGAALLAACASSPSAGTTPPIPVRHPAPAPSWAGLLPASPRLADRLVLSQTHVTAGTPIKGTLVVTNRGPVINLTRGCRPAFVVVLTNHRIPPMAAFATDCSLRPFIIAPGVTRLAFTVMTTYGDCVPAWEATDLVPACLHHGKVMLMPPLPPGHYQAVLVGDGLALPDPAPVPVILSAAPAMEPSAKLHRVGSVPVGSLYRDRGPDTGSLGTPPTSAGRGVRNTLDNS
jgi:hypothetical protein